MSKSLMISLTQGASDPDRATVAFVVAYASVASDVETVVFLSTEGVRWSQKGAADGVHEAGFKALRELMADFAEFGGKIYVCSPCFKKRGLDENNLIDGAAIVGGAKAVEFLTNGASCLSY